MPKQEPHEAGGMRGSPTTFWGKLERNADGVVVAWHPLLAHCADVAACAEALLQRTLLRRRLAALARKEDLTESDIARLCVLAAFHDIGKFNLGFQRKGDANPKDTAGHVNEALALLDSDYDSLKQRLLNALPVAALSSWSEGQGAVELLVAAIGHHGRPVKWGSHVVDPRLWADTASLRPFEGIAELTTSVRRWFPRAFEDQDSTLPSSPEFQHAFAGIVMLADWLGSDRHDHMFPFAETLDDRMAFARERARRAVEAIGLDPARSRTELGLAPLGFEAVSRSPPRDMQTKVLELPRDARGSLTVLESETGSGKTEAALIRFLHLFQAGLVDGMTFALPTRTAATQIHRRIGEALKRSFPNQELRPATILAVPGYLQFDDTVGRRALPGFEVLWNDDPREAVRCRGWPAEQPKRYLTGTVVIGTIDQVLLSALRVGHSHLRATALLRHLLVVDEVHASDTYMNRILEEVLRFHLSSGGHALLMSATLGSYVRHRLERAALRQQAGRSAVALDHALAVPYPVVHHASHDGRAHRLEVQRPGRAKVVCTAVEELADEPFDVAQRALAAARAGARALILRNTVSDAVATQLALESLAQPEDEPLLFKVNGVLTVHHARFAKPDRELLDVEIEKRFGKHAPHGLGVVVVTTQTVQQSLDLDADILWTDLAPMDVLLQRCGRLHRHSERDPHRPAGFETPRLVVLVGRKPLADHLQAKGAAAAGAHGVGTVYDDLLILEATRRRLLRTETLRIPDENRELVEITTHPDALERLARELGEPWLSHLGSVGGKAFAERGIAALNLVDRSARFGECSFSGTGLEERIATRLGENDRRAAFEPAVPGPFGRSVKELTIPGWLARDVPSDAHLMPTNITWQGAPFQLRFSFGRLSLCYDRLGLRREDPLTA